MTTTEMKKQSSLVVLAEEESGVDSSIGGDIRSLSLKLKYFTLDPEERVATQNQVITAFQHKTRFAQNHDSACNTQESNIEDKEDTELMNHSEYNTQVMTDPDALRGDGWIRYPNEINKIHHPRTTKG